MSATATAAGGAVGKRTLIALLQSAAIGRAGGVAAAFGGTVTAGVGLTGWLIMMIA
jgi:hypothetical protein